MENGDFVGDFKKIVLRNRIYNHLEIAVRIESIESKKVSSKNKVKYIDNIYNEAINSRVFQEYQLYNEFISEQSTGKDNEYFKIEYKINESLAVKITEHINIFRISDDTLTNKSRLVPWYCTESNIYSRYIEGRR